MIFGAVADEGSGERNRNAEKDNGIETEENPRQTATAHGQAIELEAITPLSGLPISVSLRLRQNACLHCVDRLWRGWARRGQGGRGRR